MGIWRGIKNYFQDFLITFSYYNPLFFFYPKNDFRKEIIYNNSYLLTFIGIVNASWIIVFLFLLSRIIENKDAYPYFAIGIFFFLDNFRALDYINETKNIKYIFSIFLNFIFSGLLAISLDNILYSLLLLPILIYYIRSLLITFNIKIWKNRMFIGYFYFIVNSIVFFSILSYIGGSSIIKMTVFNIIFLYVLLNFFWMNEENNFIEKINYYTSFIILIYFILLNFFTRYSFLLSI